MLTTIGSLPIIQTSLFDNEPWLMHGFGMRDITVEQYLKAFGISNVVIPETKQIHGNRVHILKAKDKVPSPILEADAFLTDQPGIVCHIRSADCVPILLADPIHHVIGAVHSGWRGTASKVLLETVATMTKEWGTGVRDIKVAIGPAIGGHCYEVGVDVEQAFEKAGMVPAPWMQESWRGHWYVDLAFANLEILEKGGVPRENIYLSLACTACDLEKFASFRKEGEKRGKQVSFILKK